MSVIIGKDEKLKRAAVWLPAKLYELAVRLRVAAYETEYLKQSRVDATVISVGNITLGGAGKTPVAHYIAGYLKSEGHSVAPRLRNSIARARSPIARALSRSCQSRIISAARLPARSSFFVS